MPVGDARTIRIYALAELAVRNTFSMWKSFRCIYDKMTLGRYTPEAVRGEPKMAPAMQEGSRSMDIVR